MGREQKMMPFASASERQSIGHKEGYFHSRVILYDDARPPPAPGSTSSPFRLIRHFRQPHYKDISIAAPQDARFSAAPEMPSFVKMLFSYVRQEHGRQIVGESDAPSEAKLLPVHETSRMKPLSARPRHQKMLI